MKNKNKKNGKTYYYRDKMNYNQKKKKENILEKMFIFIIIKKIIFLYLQIYKPIIL